MRVPGLRFFAFRFGLLFAFIIAARARTRIAQIRKIVVAGVTVRPSDIHSRAGGHVNLYRCRFFAWIKRSSHELGVCFSVPAVSLTVGVPVHGHAATPRGNRISVRTCRRVPQECTNPLIQFRTDDVFKLASLRVRFGIVYRKRILKEAFR